MRSCCCRLRGVLKRSRDVYPSSHDMLPIARAWYAVSSTFGKTLQPHGSARVHNLTYSLVLKLLTTFSHLQLLGTCFMDERANLSLCSRVHFTGEPRLPGTRLPSTPTHPRRARLNAPPPRVNERRSRFPLTARLPVFGSERKKKKNE